MVTELEYVHRDSARHMPDGTWECLLRGAYGETEAGGALQPGSWSSNLGSWLLNIKPGEQES